MTVERLHWVFYIHYKSFHMEKQYSMIIVVKILGSRATLSVFTLRLHCFPAELHGPISLGLNEDNNSKN